MKLGTETASMTNWLMSGTKGEPKPEVGMGCTELMWTDRHAATITRIGPSGVVMWIRQDKATRVDNNGMSESQSYTYVAGNGPEVKCHKTKRGWKTVGGRRLALGHRDEYHDYGF